MKITDRRSYAMGHNLQANKRSNSQVKQLVRHHTGVPVDQTMSILEGYWKSEHGWEIGGYHEVIHEDGSLDLNYDPSMMTWGVGNFNPNTMHISLTGNGKFTEAQERTWETRALLHMANLGIPVSQVKGHNEYPGHYENNCPGVNMNTVRARLQELLKPTPGNKLSFNTVVQNAINGAYGNYPERKTNVEKLGFNYNQVQKAIDDYFFTGKKPTVSTKTFAQVVQEVRDGKHGNYPERQKSVEATGQNYSKVQAEVDRLEKQPSFEQVVEGVRKGEYGNYPARKKNVEATGHNYSKVQAEVDKRENAKKTTYIHLKGHVPAWNIYPLGVAPVVKNSKGILRPNLIAGGAGLTYKVLWYEDNGKSAVIDTQDFGRGKVWIDGDATIYKK